MFGFVPQLTTAPHDYAASAKFFGCFERKCCIYSEGHMHVQVQPMQAINALNVNSWHRGPQPAENDLTVRSTPGQQQDIDSKRAEPESPTCARCLALRSFAAPSWRIARRCNQSRIRAVCFSQFAARWL